MNKITLAALVVTGCTLTGCATNSIRLDRAATMSEAGRTATAATLNLARKATDANRDAIIEIVSFDPLCALPQPIIFVGKDKAGQVRLCQIDGQNSSEPFVRFTGKDLLPTLSVIGGLTAYLDAVDEILAREPIDLVGSLSAAQADLAAIQTIVGADSKPLLDDSQQNAVKQTLTLIGEILGEARTVGDLRELERDRQKDGAKLEKSIAGLKQLNEIWAGRFSDAQNAQFGIVNQIYQTNPPADLDKRRATVANQLSIKEAAENAPEMKRKIDGLADVFLQAHKDYLELLPQGSKAKLSPAEKRKRATIIKARVRAALQSLAAIVAAF